MKGIISIMSVLILVAALALPTYAVASQTMPEQQKMEMKGEEGEGATNVLDDTAITAKVKSELAADVNIGTVVTIEVNTTDGVVTLAGKVNNADQKQLAEEIAKGVEGVVKVNNNLQVE